MTDDLPGNRPQRREFTATELDAAFDQVMGRFRALHPAEHTELDDGVDQRSPTGAGVNGKRRRLRLRKPPGRGRSRPSRSRQHTTTPGPPGPS
ncbi:MAG: hypothetical protein HOY78_01280 [Saccharothrix sp.]|nr:hypothetical protein [Saccharothrix sp.]